MEKYEIEFACGPDGDHTIPLTECTKSSTKVFTKINQLLDFIGECSYVYDLEKLMNKVSKDKGENIVPIRRNQVIIKEESYD